MSLRALEQLVRDVAEVALMGGDVHNKWAAMAAANPVLYKAWPSRASAGCGALAAGLSGCPHAGAQDYQGLNQLKDKWEVFRDNAGVGNKPRAWPAGCMGRMIATNIFMGPELRNLVIYLEGRLKGK